MEVDRRDQRDRYPPRQSALLMNGISVDLTEWCLPKPAVIPLAIKTGKLLYLWHPQERVAAEGNVRRKECKCEHVAFVLLNTHTQGACRSGGGGSGS